MKPILYTQRVEIVQNYGERRDCADQKIADFLSECGFLPVALPNHKELALQIVGELQPAGIVLTGGNSLVKYGGDAPERDEMEHALLECACKRHIPVYGFCRGMQMVLDFYGCELEHVSGHVAVRHEISGAFGTRSVNSYHNQACRQVKAPLEVLAQTAEGVIEAVRVKEHQILATMWHPEREHPFDRNDTEMLRHLFVEE